MIRVDPALSGTCREHPCLYGTGAVHKVTLKAHYQGIIEGFGSDYSLCGKFMVFVTIMCASIVRIMSCVLYFTSTLGLFDLLRHYQGDYGT